MFVESLLDSSARSAAVTRENRLSFLLSFGMQAALAAVIIVLPLLHPQHLLPHAIEVTLAPPVLTPPRVAVPETQHMHVVLTMANSVSAPAAIVSGPSRLPATNLQPGTAGPPSLGAVNMSGNTSPLALPLGSGHPSIAVSKVSGLGSATAGSGRARISSGVSAGLLLTPIQPVYPEIAKVARVQGTVTVDAVISSSGQIESAHATNGPLMLQAAAVEAVRHARYHPFLLNGKPTEADATFTIRFMLNQ